MAPVSSLRPDRAEAWAGRSEVTASAAAKTERERRIRDFLSYGMDATVAKAAQPGTASTGVSVAVVE
ncbi:hypothetical protein GCM10022419_056850 [Nonomuraea rosea]|uniref:Uncharacterized protein n=1 Tax=Nonomuraea rosea TaxID=638574 RepID=A0ABP6XR15_9ACTN